MKTFLVFPLAMLCGCSAARPPLTVRPQVAMSASKDSPIRQPETVRAYHVGRYVDPNNGQLLHEHHAVYRIETSSRWNLIPELSEGIAMPVSDEYRGDRPSGSTFSDASVAEVNRQKLITTQMMARSAEINASLAELQIALRGMKTGIEEAAVLRSVVTRLELRLRQLEAAQSLHVAPPSANEAGQLLQTETDLLRP